MEVNGLRQKAASGLSLFLTAVLVLGGCSTIPHSLDPVSSASAPPPVSAVQTLPPFALSFSKEDSLHPYQAKSRANLDLAPLLYEGLTAIGADYTARLSLAASLDDTDPLKPVATIRADAVFSDGSPVTAQDVAASFTAAKATAHYGPLLTNVTGAAAVSADRVVFTLAARDPGWRACLSFPVVKQDSGNPPLGSGAYVYSAGEDTLTLRPGRDGSITSIRLRDFPDADAMLHGLENGSLTFFYSELSNGEIPRTSSATAEMPLPDLLFLGINSKNAALRKAEVRSALSAAVSREELVSGALVGRGTPAVSPFPPQWADAADVNLLNRTENIAAAVAQLEQAGYNTTDSAGGLSFELLVTEGNKFRKTAADLIQQQLLRTGITVTVIELSFADYESRLKKGQFDLYLGEIRLSADMHLRALLSPGGAASYGLAADSPAAAAYGSYLAGDKTLAAFCEDFAADLPYIPLCWRQGMAAFHRSLSGLSPHAFDVFHDLGSWIYA